MNPQEIPQNSIRQVSHNLDESQSSSVSIKIYNKNDDNVVIRLYRNNKKSSRDRLKKTFVHQRKSAGREGKDKRKPTMLRNLYRNTFGPTLDETVLVGMETFQICQQEVSVNDQSLNVTNTSNFQGDLRKNSNVPNTSKFQGDQRKNSNVPNTSNGELRKCCNAPNSSNEDLQKSSIVPNKPKGEPRKCSIVPNTPKGDLRKNSAVPNTSNKDLQKNNCFTIPNELSWDCSTLLPTNSNPKEFESVYTNTSNCELDKEKILSPLLTNQYHYSPLPRKNEAASCDSHHTPSTKTIKPLRKSKQMDEKCRALNNISSDENLTLKSDCRRRSGGDRFSNREETNPKQAFDEKQIKTAHNSKLRKSSGYDDPSNRYSFNAGQEEPWLNEERSYRDTARSSTFPPRTSEMVPRASRRSSMREPSVMQEAFDEGNEDSSKKIMFSNSLPRVAYIRDPSTSSMFIDDNPRRSSFGVPENFDENPRRSSVQRRSTSAEEPPRRISSRIADFFRRGSRRSTSPDSSPAKSVAEPRNSRRSTTPRRSSLPRQSFVEEGEPIQEDLFRRSTIAAEGRGSKAFLNNLKRTVCPNSACLAKLRSREDLPRRSTFSSEPVEDGPRPSRRSLNPRRSSLRRQSMVEDEEPEHEDIWRRSTVAVDDYNTRNSFNSRRSTSSFLAGSNEDIPNAIDPTEDYEDGPRKSRRSSTPRRSSLARQSLVDDDEPLPEDIWRRTTAADTERRESANFQNNSRRSSASPYTSFSKPYEIEGYIRTGSYDEDVPALINDSPETFEGELERGRRSSTPIRRSSLHRRSIYEDEEPTQDEMRRSTMVGENHGSFVHNSRRSSFSPAKSIELEGLNEDLPRVSTYSPEAYEGLINYL